MSSPLMPSLMKKLFLIGSIIVIITGLTTGVVGANYDWMFGLVGAALGVIGLIFLITGYTSKSIMETREAKGLSILMIAGCLLAFIGLTSLDSYGGGAVAVGAIVVILSFILWPCFCCQGGKNIRSQIVGVVSAHDSISIDEISKTTGYSEDSIRKILYDAIGKGELHGRMEGSTFIRSAPSAPAYGAPGATTKEKETAKVLVICPYCGAKTEQGISKCQKCHADL